MKKVISLLLAMIAVVSQSACGSSDVQKNIGPEASQEEITPNQSQDHQTENSKQGKVLVAYFSWADNTVPDNILLP